MYRQIYIPYLFIYIYIYIYNIEQRIPQVIGGYRIRVCLKKLPVEDLTNPTGDFSFFSMLACDVINHLGGDVVFLGDLVGLVGEEGQNYIHSIDALML